MHTCTSMHKWHFHIYMYKDKICWYKNFYRLGRADIGCKLKFVYCSTCTWSHYMLMHPICPNSLEHCIRHTGTSIHVFSFWIITFFQFLKAWRSPYKWNHFDSLCSLKEWVSFFLGSWGNESQRGTNKSCEPRSGSRLICLFRATIHSPWTQKKRHSFLIFTMLPTKTLSKIPREKL